MNPPLSEPRANDTARYILQSCRARTNHPNGPLGAFVPFVQTLPIGRWFCCCHKPSKHEITSVVYLASMWEFAAKQTPNRSQSHLHVNSTKARGYLMLIIIRFPIPIVAFQGRERMFRYFGKLAINSPQNVVKPSSRSHILEQSHGGRKPIHDRREAALSCLAICTGTESPSLQKPVLNVNSHISPSNNYPTNHRNDILERGGKYSQKFTSNK